MKIVHVHPRMSVMGGGERVAIHSIKEALRQGHEVYFVSEKFEQIENTGDADYPRIAEDFERLILRREVDPVKMDCEASGKNSEVKVDAGQRGEAKRNAEDVQPLHTKKYRRAPR